MFSVVPEMCDTLAQQTGEGSSVRCLLDASLADYLLCPTGK